MHPPPHCADAFIAARTAGASSCFPSPTAPNNFTESIPVVDCTAAAQVSLGHDDDGERPERFRADAFKWMLEATCACQLLPGGAALPSRCRVPDGGAPSMGCSSLFNRTAAILRRELSCQSGLP